MISDAVNEILNEQINKEFHSGYLYLSMSTYLKHLGLNGFASWLKIQAREEVEHGLKILDYLVDCDSFVTLKQIKMPEFEFTNILEIFNIILDHEKCITRAIMSVAKMSEDECDRTTLNFIDWFDEHTLGWGYFISLGIIAVLTIFMFIVLIVNTRRKK